MADAPIALTDVTPRPRHEHATRREYDAPYRWFIGAALSLALFGGFALALAVALAGAFEWDWGARPLQLSQAHGQLQLIGFGGLFTGGVAFRLMPRFSGHPLRLTPLVRFVIPLVGGSLILRALAEPASDGALRDAGLLVSAGLLVVGAGAFAAIVLRTIARPDTRAEATAYFFSLGSVGFFAASILNFALVVEVVNDSLQVAPMLKQSALVFVEQYGFTLFFICGIGTRAVPNFTGRPRPYTSTRVIAVALAAGVALFACGALWIAHQGVSGTAARAANAGLLLISASLISVAWLSGVFNPSADRVATASGAPFWFVRSAFAWMVFTAALLAWYGARGFADAALPEAHALDAARHTLALGVLTVMIMGMGMMILPEFAGRRLQHPNEDALVIVLVVVMNIAVVMRIWPSIEGIGWLGNTRYWPMVISGTLATVGLASFAAMFFQSYFEQRDPGWARPQNLPARRAARR